jgi:hypothetical protein
VSVGAGDLSCSSLALAGPRPDGPSFAQTRRHQAERRAPPEALGEPLAESRPEAAGRPADDQVARDAAAAAVARAAVRARMLPVTPADASYELVLPVADSAKLFVGPNGTYYDDAWRWMEWRGTRRSWNWPAALTFGGWFAYRRMAWQADAGLAGQGLALALALNGLPLWLVAAALLVVGLALGRYANHWYCRRFRRAVGVVARQRERSYGDRLGRLAAAGGTDPAAAWRFGAAAAALGLAVLGLTIWLRGGLTLRL